MGSNAEIESMFFGNEAAGFSWGTAAGVAAPFAIWEAGSLLSGGGIPSLTEVPGLIYEGIFGGGDSMSPEEAVKNWDGTLNYMTKMSEQMRALGLEFDELQQGLDGGGFALFGQSAQEAAQALEHLHTVAGYSQAQIDALVGSLDPLTQEFLASGQAANDLGGLVSGLVQEMNAATESYNMTSGALNNYNQYIDSLAQRLGLSGEAARSFREQIWDLAEGFSSGGEEAERFDQALNEFVSHTLGSLTEGAEDGTAAIKDLIDSLSHARGMGEGLVGLGVTGGLGRRGLLQGRGPNAQRLHLQAGGGDRGDARRGLRDGLAQGPRRGPDQLPGPRRGAAHRPAGGVRGARRGGDRHHPAGAQGPEPGGRGGDLRRPGGEPARGDPRQPAGQPGQPGRPGPPAGGQAQGAGPGALEGLGPAHPGGWELRCRLRLGPGVTPPRLRPALAGRLALDRLAVPVKLASRFCMGLPTARESLILRKCESALP